MPTNKIIGGEFTPADFDGWFVEDPAARAEDFFPERLGEFRRHLFETGADALADILLDTGFKTPVVAYPLHFCPDTIERTRTKLAFHGCEADFRPYAGPGNIMGADVVLAVHFNRYEGEIIKSFPPGDYVFIEDFVHCPLDMDKMTGPYAFTSLRKFCFLSVAVSYKESADNAGVPGPSEYLLERKQAASIKTAFRRSGDKEDERRYLRLFDDAEQNLRADGNIRRADSKDASFLDLVKFSDLREVRRKNLRVLEKLLSPLPFEILPHDYMYLMIDTPRRDELRSKMFENNIYPPIHWQDAGSELAKSVLSFHADQRYDDEDLQRVAQVAADFFGA